MRHYRLIFSLNELCFIGDDLVDLSLMRKVGLPIAVANASSEIKEAAVYITNRQGGRGAVREVDGFFTLFISPVTLIGAYVWIAFAVLSRRVLIAERVLTERVQQALNIAKETEQKALALASDMTGFSASVLPRRTRKTCPMN